MFPSKRYKNVVSRRTRIDAPRNEAESRRRIKSLESDLATEKARTRTLESDITSLTERVVTLESR